MGSSTRKFQKHIKKIMEDIDPNGTDDNINTIFSEAIKLRKNKNFFYNGEFGNAVTGGINAINLINSGKLPKIKDEIQSPTGEFNQVLVQDILDKILDNLDNDGNTITDELILRAFKIAMAELILSRDLSIDKFVELFVKKSLFLLILEDVHESSLEEFGFITTDKIEDKLEKLSNHLVEKYLVNNINSYVNGKMQFENLVESIIKLKSKINEEDI